jgi:hypothetical protein
MVCVYPWILRTDRIYPEPGLYLKQERHRIRHHFHLKDRIAPFLLLFQDQALQPAVKRWDKHLAPRLRTEDNRVLAAIYDGAVTV